MPLFTATPTPPQNSPPHHQNDENLPQASLNIDPRRINQQGTENGIRRRRLNPLPPLWIGHPRSDERQHRESCEAGKPTIRSERIPGLNALPGIPGETGKHQSGHDHQFGWVAKLDVARQQDGHPPVKSTHLTSQGNLVGSTSNHEP